MVLQEGILGDPEKTLRFVAFFSLLIPRVTPYDFPKMAF